VPQGMTRIGRASGISLTLICISQEPTIHCRLTQIQASVIMNWKTFIWSLNDLLNTVSKDLLAQNHTVVIH